MTRTRPPELTPERLSQRERMAEFLLRCSPQDFGKMAALMTQGHMTGLEAFEAIWKQKT